MLEPLKLNTTFIKKIQELGKYYESDITVSK